MQTYALSSSDFVEAIEETVKPSEEKIRECDQEEQLVGDGRCNRTWKTAELREGSRMEENAEDDLEGEDAAKTMEACGGRNREDGGDEEEEEGGEEEEEGSSYISSLAELNLLIVILSLCSASHEESLNSEEEIITARRRAKNNEEKVSASRLKQPRVRKIDELKVLGRQTPPMRFQTTIKDSRHGRKF